MTELQAYTDARELVSGFEKHLCPHCGVIRWFKHQENDYERDYWYCQTCGNWLRDQLEYPCPECDTRMILDGWHFECRNERCSHTTTAINRENLVDRLSCGDYMVDGMPGIRVGDCPICGEEHSVNGGPDGELECRDNNDFYAGRYSDQWFCYAIWMDEPETIRVNDL